MFIIGLTGPSGAGKTTALRVLEQLGGRVFDCDAVYHEMLRTDPELLGQIEAAFPGAVQDGVLDRKALGAKLFADPAGLQRLTELTQPLVAKRVLEEIRATEVAARHSEPCPERSRKGSEESVPPSPDAWCLVPDARRFAVIDAIGLFESGLGAECDLTAAVIADPKIRVRRLTARDGVTEAYARARIAAQKPASWFASKAELVLENNGTEAEFAEKCRAEFTKRLQKGEAMREYTCISLRERPELEKAAAAWFHDKWGVPEEAYLECMDAYLSRNTELGWYLCLCGDEIVGGLGVIENDFHDRKDLSPNVCAMYVEEAHRCRGIAGRLLNLAVEELRARGISPVYLVTDHTGFYERYGWEYFCPAQGDGEDHLTRLYIHR